MGILNGLNKHIIPSMKYGLLSLFVFFSVNLIGVLSALIMTDLTFEYSLSFFDQSLYHFSVKETEFHLSGSFVLLVVIFVIGLLIYFIKLKVTE
ncbi:hypothetical protein ACQ4XT_13710 [Halobacillus faecis]